MILRYATPVIALLIATLAVIGPTRAPNADGRDVITYWGWITIAAAVAPTSVSASTTTAAWSEGPLRRSPTGQRSRPALGAAERRQILNPGWESGLTK